jgi:hypothetical protein
MRTPGRIALFGAVALSFTIFVAPAVWELLGRTDAGVWSGAAITATVIQSALLGILVWIGTYLAARLVTPHQRSVRLMQALVAIYVVIGFSLTMPINTHAVKLDLPLSANGHFVGEQWIVLVTPLVVALTIVGVSFAVTRGVAAMCAKL